MDLLRAKEVLERNHYGMEKVKDRILEFLAVRQMTTRGEAPIICLVGPPGTGKTSIAKSVAESLGKQYQRICLGGVRDEAEIRGHRRTYVGAMMGQVANALRDRLSGFSGVFSGYHFQGCFEQGQRTRFDRDPPATWFTDSRDFTVHWAKA